MQDVADRNNLAGAMAENPLDAALRRVFADWLEENGEPEEADSQRAFAGVLESPLNRDLGDRIAAAVTKANGARRAARCLSWLDAAETAWRAFRSRDRAEYIHGGGVANSYGYPASTSLVLVYVRADGRVCVDGGEAAARKAGGSPANVWPELARWEAGSKGLIARLAEWSKTR
jgi:uncharacterized protein (TIGR02996 family)